MNSDVLEMESELRKALLAARSRGWRLADLESVRPPLLDRPYGDLFARLDSGFDLWRQTHGLSSDAALHLGRRTVAFLSVLPSLPVVAEHPETDGVDPGVLSKVRALLAKAESTTFPAEAEALTAKAHELMTRHTIDRAVLEGSAVAGEVSARRLMVEAPYARARFSLLSAIARSCGCRVVWWPRLGLVTVFGFDADLEATELLYTSLLLQATTAMKQSSGRRESSARTAAFRRAFLYAFAARIGQRLRTAADAAVAAAAETHGDALLPVLASREEAVEAAVAAAAPKTSSVRISFSDHDGYRAGVAAADRATLTTQRSVDGRRAIASGTAG
jgi:hypothetical protein